jgi:hypothetical protein
MRVVMTLTVSLAVTFAAVAAAQTDTGAARAFERYEAIRAALVRERLADVPANAAALVPLASALAGQGAAASAERVRVAKTLAQARQEFGDLSLILVPKFLEAKLPGVVGFACAMKPNAVWAQRGDSIENPYFGAVMLNCGAPLRSR